MTHVFKWKLKWTPDSHSNPFHQHLTKPLRGDGWVNFTCILSASTFSNLLLVLVFESFLPTTHSFLPSFLWPSRPHSTSLSWPPVSFQTQVRSISIYKKSISFRYTNNEHADTKFKSMMLVTLAPEKTNCLDTPLCPLAVRLCSPRPWNPWQQLIHFLSLYICLTWKCHTNGIKSCVVFGVWLLSLSTFSRVICVVAWTSASFFLWPNNIPLYGHCLSVHHWWTFQLPTFSAVINNASVDIYIYSFSVSICC